MSEILISEITLLDRLMGQWNYVNFPLHACALNQLRSQNEN